VVQAVEFLRVPDQDEVVAQARLDGLDDLEAG